jgi:hypothetical protein
MAALQVRHIADLYWMKYEGHRAPTENFSKFWDEQEKPSQAVNDILDGL